MDTIEKKKLAIERQKALLKKQIALLKMEEQKAKNRQLIKLGKLIEKAGLSHLREETLLGALFYLKKKLSNPNASSASLHSLWAQAGKEQFTTKKKPLTPIIITFEPLIPKEIAPFLRKIGLRWNSIRKEWQGFVNKQELETLVKNLKYKITIPEKK